MKKLFFLFLLVQLNVFTFAQDKETNTDTLTSFNLGVDLANRYIWRGIKFSTAPAIQPYISYTHKGFTFGTWASYAFVDDDSQEVDLFVSYKYSIFKFTLNDYFFVLNPFGNYNDYFNWDKNTSSHYLEAILEVSEIKNLPLRFLAGVMLLGGDVDTNQNRQFSTYLEFAYNLKIKNTGAEVFVGFTPFEGFYSDGFDFTNIGIKLSKEIEITQKFSLPFSTAFIMNPAEKTVMFQLMVSF